MHFDNRRLKEEYEALQVDLLRTEVEMKRQQVESQRLANERERKILNPAPVSPWLPGSATGFSVPANDHKSLY